MQTIGRFMQAQVVLHLPNLYSQHCSTQYTFVNVCFWAEKKLLNNVTCNHDKPLSHISQLHPFDAPCWTALPNYGTDAHWIPPGAIVGANNDWPHLLIVRSHCRAAKRFHTHTPAGSYAGNFHMPGRHFTASLLTGYFLGHVVSLTADTHPLARGNLRPITVDLLQPHPH
ncbi:hypothetical protein O181_100558 [Austropuccinia psidii MF-1]|uniref:Uncharacterized protein n=1 Tax=Austropuccinia psidii MF-1 TaxID=1389203 RepID=A0A9Q3JCX8_9BASI|nr:hypothetical protein [Austropuccinia psidii MF-1]